MPSDNVKETLCYFCWSAASADQSILLRTYSILLLVVYYSMRMCYVYGMRESTGKYTEVWQRLGSESLRVALAYCLH